jgi:uncharacterized protein YrrD
MICRVGDLQRFTLGATDGDIGEIKDVYFDDERWVIRYLVVDTGKWLPGRKVLISPMAVRTTEWVQQRVDVGLTRQQVQNSPDIDANKPVSRQMEEAYFTYFGYPYYWAGPGLWGASAYPIVPPPISPELRGADTSTGTIEEKTAAHQDSHLRSTREVIGYPIEAVDGTVGHIENFLFDEQSWQILYIEVDTRNWWPGKHVLMAPDWIDEMSWVDGRAHVHATRAAVKESPPYDPTVPLTGDYEADLHSHYGRPFRR